MSGHDKHMAMERLKEQGWIEDVDSGRYMLRPPGSLLEQLASMVFHVYDARDLQAFVVAPEQSEQAGK